jgi:hypothetical protein
MNKLDKGGMQVEVAFRPVHQPTSVGCLLFVTIHKHVPVPNMAKLAMEVL